MFTFITYLSLMEDIAEPALYRNVRDIAMQKAIEADAMAPRTTHRVLGKSYQGISMSRNPRLGGRAAGWYGDWWLMFDKTRLAHDYKILPIDADLAHYVTRNKKTVQALTQGQLKLNRDRIIRQEFADQHAEELVLGTIQPLHKYLLRIVSLHLTVEKGTPIGRRKLLQEVQRYAQKHNIPFFDAREREHGEWKHGQFSPQEKVERVQ